MVQVKKMTTGCLLDYSYFKDHYKIIAIDLSKQQALHADRRAIQQINFTVNLDRAGNKQCCLLLVKILEFSQGPVNAISLNAKYSLIFISIKCKAIKLTT